jgi:hypothetical protein
MKELDRAEREILALVLTEGADAMVNMLASMMSNSKLSKDQAHSYVTLALCMAPHYARLIAEAQAVRKGG